MKRFVVFLLSVVAAAAMLGAFPATVRADDAVPLKGIAKYTLTSATREPDGTTLLTYGGTGHATLLGSFTADANIVFLVPFTTYSVTGVLTAANGDQIFFSGEAAFTSPTTDAGTLTITGGTGRFMNATGEGDFADVFSDGIKHAAQTFEGTIEF